VSKAIPEHRARKALKVSRAHKALREIPEPLVPLARRGIREIKAIPEQRD
jgi:hypothetical protein